MRVYEYAKKMGVSSKELITLLKRGGSLSLNHLSLLSQKELVLLNSTYTNPEKQSSGEETPLAEIKNVEVRVGITVGAFAEKLGCPVGDVLLSLLKKGVVCNCNFVLSKDLVEWVAHKFGATVSFLDEKSKGILDKAAGLEAGGGKPRSPIVVVMGHVDHGKTTFLDRVRKANVAAGETGGITQGISASEVETSHGKIVFLDTPGHEAFSAIRKRGAFVTDLFVLIIAVDDGVMPQTIEAIEHIKQVKAPVVVAINKVDKDDDLAAIEKIKRQLAQHDLLPEDWGGDIVCVPISAKTGKGVDTLLEMIVLQAQMMELIADSASQAKGFVLESRQQRGVGLVATAICLQGTVRVGDYFVCGRGGGRVRILLDCQGKKVAAAGPSVPIQIIGFDSSFVEVGEWIEVVSIEKYRTAKGNRESVSVDADRPVFSLIGSPEDKVVVPVIVKADTNGSVDAVESFINNLNGRELKKGDSGISLKIVSSGVGNIFEGDVDLAMQAGSGALVIGFRSSVERNALLLAKRSSVEVEVFDLIYDVGDFLEESIVRAKKKNVRMKKVGEALVKKVFNMKKKGVVAGCEVVIGSFLSDATVVCIRNDKKVGGGKISSLQEERNIVKEVAAGKECGFVVEGFRDWRVGDLVYCMSEG
jgi:translation initiation factor IF-2